MTKGDTLVDQNGHEWVAKSKYAVISDFIITGASSQPFFYDKVLMSNGIVFHVYIISVHDTCKIPFVRVTATCNPRIVKKLGERNENS